MGALLGMFLIIGYLLKKPLPILLWIPISAALLVLAHFMFGPMLGLMPIREMGLADAFFMYLPSAAIASMLGGILGTLLPFRRG